MGDHQTENAAGAATPAASDLGPPAHQTGSEGSLPENRQKVNGDIFAAALKYAARGWPVLPLWWPRPDGTCACGQPSGLKHKIGKHPIGLLVPNGVHGATTDPEMIKRWFAQYPNANVGIAMRDMLVVDTDHKDGINGADSLRALEQENSALPWTLTADSGSRLGKHRFFSHPGGVGCAGNFRPKLDIIGNGGYVVAAPSNHISGGRYEWINLHTEIATAPAWLIDLLGGDRDDAEPGQRSDAAPAQVAKMEKKCLFLKHCREHASEIDGGLWNAAATNYAFLGAAGVDAFHELSKLDSGRYDKHQTQKRLDKAKGPAQCATIARHGWRCPNMDGDGKCSLPKGGRSPIVLAAVKKPRASNAPDVFFAHDPLPMARAFLAEKHDGDGLRHWRGDFYGWDGRCWLEREQGSVRADLYTFMEPLMTLNLNGDKVPFAPNKHSVSTAIDALQAVGHLPTEIEPPHYLEGTGPSPLEMVAFNNGVLNLKTMALTAPDKCLFALHALNCDHDPTAKAPKFEDFLKQALSDEGTQPDQDTDDTINMIEEFMGLLMVPDTSRQKAMLMLGPPRSGRGTLIRIIRELVGPRNFAGPTTQSFGGDFGLEQLIGKLVAAISDARTGGRVDVHTLVERILTITGEDAQSINRKNNSFWHGKLPTRLIVVSNEMPKFVDASGAIASRFIIAKFRRSFLGRENWDLTNELLAELPGIANLAIAGWHRLMLRGRFKQPGSGQALLDEMLRSAHPVRMWVDDRVTLEANAATPVRDAYADFKTWCEDNGCRVTPSNSFGKDLLAAHKELTAKKITLPGENDQTRCYVGLKLQPRPVSDDPAY